MVTSGINLHARSMLLRGVSALALMSVLTLFPQASKANSCSIDGNGSVTADCSDFSLSSGSSLARVTNGVTISGSTPYAISNGGSIGTLSNSGYISGSQNAIVNTNTITSISNSGTIVGLLYGGLYNNAGAIDDVTNSGRLAGLHNGVVNSGGIGALSNSGVISGTTMNGIRNESGGSIGTLTNNGTITSGLSNSGTGQQNGVWNKSGGTITKIINTDSGVFSGYNNGLLNNGVLGSLENSGNISSNQVGVGNYGTISSLVNGAGATISGNYTAVNNQAGAFVTTLTNNNMIIGGGVGVENNQSTIRNLTNTGTISGGSTGFLNSEGSIGTLTNNGAIKTNGTNAFSNERGTIDALINVGTINNGAVGLASSGVIGVLENRGLISGNSAGMKLDGQIGPLTNSGTISGQTGIRNFATIASLTNSGTISGSVYAINNSQGQYQGKITTITNSGVIAGDMSNDTSNGLTISGSDGSYGLLTGYNNGAASLTSPGAVGTITNTSADIVFASGKIWLNDNIDVGSHSVSVTNATLKISNPITISGSYLQTGGGLVMTGGGTITMSNGSTASLSHTAIIISGSNLTAGSYTIVNSSTAGTYDLATDTVSVFGTGGLTGSLSIEGDNLLVSLVSGTSTTYTGKGQSSGGAAAGMGTALDAIAASNSTVATAFQSNVLTPLASLPSSSQLAAIKQLAPTQITPSAQAAIQAAPTTSVIEQHELALLDSSKAGAAAGSAGHDFGLWGQMLGGGALRSGNAEADGYRSRSFGLVSGLDYQLSADTTLGGALSWVRGWSWGADNSVGNYTTSNSYQITGYGLHRWGAVFVDGQIGFGYNTYDQTRVIGFLGQDAKASYNGEQYLAKAGVGYDVALGDGLIVTPLAGWRFLRAVSDGYTESGSSANLTVDRRGVQSLTQDLGGKVSWALDSDWGKLTPEVRLAWVHDYTKGPIASSGIMGGQVFTSTVARPNPDGAKLNLAATLETMGDVSFRAEYEGELRPDYQSHSGLIKATWGF